MQPHIIEKQSYFTQQQHPIAYVHELPKTSHEVPRPSYEIHRPSHEMQRPPHEVQRPSFP